MSMFFIGVDLGKKRDYTAIAVVERMERANRSFDYERWTAVEERLPEEYIVRSVRRLALGTPYPAVAARLAEETRDRRVAGQCRMVVDATGVGVAVVDLLEGAGLGCELTAVTLTGGGSARFEGKDWRAPKVEVLTHLQVLLEQGRLRVSKYAKEAGMLVRELLDVRVREGRGGMRLGAEGSGEHDDLVMAVALAAWAGSRGRVELKRAEYGFIGRRVL